MARYRIGNDITVLWTINDKDGKPLNLEGKEVHLYYTCERGRYEADINVQGDNANIVVWEFNGGSQRALGGYTLTLEILQSEGKRSIKKDICNAFTLVGKDCEACETHGDAWINEEGEISLVSDLDVYRISPVIPYVGPNKNWWVDGVDTGMSAVGTTAYQYAVTLGYEGSEEEYAKEAAAVPKLTENMRFVTEGANRAKEEALRAAEGANNVIEDLDETLQTKAEKSVVEKQGAQLAKLSATVPTKTSQLSNDAGFITKDGVPIPDWNASTYKEGHIKNRTHHMQDYMCHYFKGSPIKISKPSGVGYVLLAYDTDLADKFIRIEISASESKTHEFLDAMGMPLIFTWDADNSTINVESFMGAVETYDMRAYYSSSANSFDEYFVKLDKGFLPEEAMSQISMISITYSELVSLRDSGKLIAGMQYRITDYVTTTTQTDTESAGHPFDIIVTADNENTLNKVARAVLHEGDTYFAEAKLEAWQIWYCLDNDTERFGWADAENGKGVIYRMIDEFDNDCPYDFKNIKFVRWELEKPTMLNGEGLFVEIIPSIINYLSPETYKWAASRMDDYPLDEEYSFGGFFISAVTNQSKSFFTFTDEQGTTDLSLAGTSHHNTIKENSYWDDEHFSENSLNQIVLFNPCFRNNFERDCYKLTLISSSDNSFGERVNSVILNESSEDIFGSDAYNILLQRSYKNKFLRDTYNIVLNNCSENSFLEGSNTIAFEYDCSSNIIGQSDNRIGFRNTCNLNIFETGCFSIFLSNTCILNKFRGPCMDLTLGEMSRFNTFDGCSTIRFNNGVANYNIIKPGVSNVTLVGNGTNNTDEIRYIEVDGSVQGASGSPIQVTVPVNANYSNKVARKSDGTVVVFNEADLVN